MTTTLMWALMILAPDAAAGRQVGAFVSQEQCAKAERIYNERFNHHWAPQSKCIEVAAPQSKEKTR